MVGGRQENKRRGLLGLRRWFESANAVISVLLVAILTVMINFLAYRHLHLRRDVSVRGLYRLSEKTQTLLADLDVEVGVYAIFQKGHERRDEVLELLRAYEFEDMKDGRQRLRVEIVDPDRDLARMAELAKKYEIDQSNLLIFDCRGRRKYVPSSSLVDTARKVEMDAEAGQGVLRTQTVAFRAEEEFSSSIQSVASSSHPVVYFLGGHGERSIEDFNRSFGYSDIVHAMRRDNIEVRTLLLGSSGVPEDCSVLVVAGPDRRFSDGEVSIVSQYLDRNGRLFLLLDPDTTTGLDGLLNRWGLTLSRDVVVDPQRTLTGRELFVDQYADHPVTRHFKNISTVFYMPRSIVPAAGAVDSSSDKPRIVVLAACSDQGWAESDLAQSPPRWDEGRDRKGPVPVAVAVEKGVQSKDIAVDIRPTRMVVLGDSDFVSNASLRSGVGGNQDFFLGAVNWLSEREQRITISPKDPGILRLNLDRERQRWALLLIVLGMPGAVALFGMLVWGIRRR